MNVFGWRSWLLAGAALVAASATCAVGALEPGGGGAGDAGTGSGQAGTDGGQTGCASAADCPAPQDPCELATCHAGICGQGSVPAGTVIKKDVPANCHATICDVMGNTRKAVDVDNLPVSSDPCLTGTCDMTGVAGTAPAAAGVPCSSGGQLCDGAGNCVQCLHDADCPPGHTCGVLNACMGPPCMDGVRDGAETDVDCGGTTCPPCGTGQMCQQGSDCATGVCNPAGHTCLSPQCSDGVKDGNETDVDCGGACLACGLGTKCMSDQDCASKACDTVSLTCVASQCSDHQKDGPETDVDCGGPCTPCALGKTCLVGSDCVSGTCDSSSLLCTGSPCMNGVKDGTETDVDCGGGICPGCPLGKHCLIDADCSSNACDVLSLTCVADPCSDHRQDGKETDIDCGGADACARCAAGKKCITTADCAAGLVCPGGNPHVCQ